MSLNWRVSNSILNNFLYIYIQFILSFRYRGAAHQACNLNYRDARFIPIVFHNLTGYDSHLIIKELAASKTCEGRVSIIAENKQKYISFTKFIKGSDFNLRFIDSFRFLASSLDTLSSYLDNTPILTKEFQKDGYTVDQIPILRRKGVYPYDFTSSFDSLKVTELPSIQNFYSFLNESGISDDDYEHARLVWNTFRIKTLGEYSDLYLKTDVLLLSDVFENFRESCRQSYGLDVGWYYTLPGFSWDAMLKYTNIFLELLTDIEKLLFVEKGLYLF